MRLDERGKQCPLPVLEAKAALEKEPAGTVIEAVVDNVIAVQNLTKMAEHKGYQVSSEKISDQEYVVKLVKEGGGKTTSDIPACLPDGRKKGLVVAIASDQMGQGDEVLGRLLMKSFLFALAKQDQLPETVLLFNGGAKLSITGSDSLEDLKVLEAQGVEVLTCGTCLNHYGIGDQLAVGGVTNMYEIVEKMTGARQVVRP